MLQKPTQVAIKKQPVLLQHGTQARGMFQTVPYVSGRRGDHCVVEERHRPTV